MKDKIIYDNITFEKYNPNDLNHANLVLKLAKHSNQSNKFDDWREMLKDSTSMEHEDDTYAYITSIDGKHVGVCTVSINEDNSCVFSQKLLPKYFNELASAIRYCMIEELIENNIERIATIVPIGDEVAINALLNSGYSEETFKPIGDTDYIQVTLYNRTNEKNM